MGRPELITHPDMDTNAKRVKNHEMVRRIVEKWTVTYDSKELVDLLLSKGMPSCQIYDIGQVSEDPQIVGDRKMFIEEEHPRIGKLKITNTHIKMSETEAGFRQPPPDLGQHNEDIYGGLLGITKEELAGLKEEKLI